MNKILLDLPNRIITPRLILRPPQAGDGSGIHQIIADGYEDLVQWLYQPPELPAQEHFEIEARQHHAEWILRNDMRLLITDRETGTIMGKAAYPPRQCHWDVPCFGIGYMLARKHQGKGYVTEAVNAMIRFAFIYFKARKVEVKCDVENIKSMAVPKRLGMQLEAIQRGNWPRRDKEELAETTTYSIFNINDLPPLEVTFE